MFKSVIQAVLCRPDGGVIHLLSPKVLHIMDRSLWLLPFAIRSDLETAAKVADVSIKARADFLNELLAEHERPNARAELKALWKQWIETNYPDEVAAPSLAGRPATKGAASGRAPTPPVEDSA